jgi:ribosomal protein L40E
MRGSTRSSAIWMAENSRSQRRTAPARARARARAHREPVGAPQPAAPAQAPRGEGLSRSLVRILTWTLPLGTLVVAVAVGFVFDVASGFLVLVSGALLGAILLLWFSLRTLAGDVPTDPLLEATAASRMPRTELSERKRRALRSLKDLEQEHAVGKIDDADYAKLLAEYRTLAKAVIREMDDSLAPQREEAEELIRAHLKKRHIEPAQIEAPKKVEVPAPSDDDDDDEGEDDEPADDDEAASEASERLACPSCKTSNEPDATFCKKCGAKLGRPAAAEDEDEDEDDRDEDADDDDDDVPKEDVTEEDETDDDDEEEEAGA